MQYKYIFPFISNLKYIPLDIGKKCTPKGTRTPCWEVMA